MSSETITRNDLENILNEVLPSTAVDYVVETHIEPLTIATNEYAEATFTTTKSGYFPLGIVGYRIGWVSGETGKCNVCSVKMTNKSEGSVTVAYGVYNVTSASVSMNLRVDILWAKVNGAFASFQTDYIVEQGTDGDWTYRKWNSGIAECWGTTRFTNVPLTAQCGYGYYASNVGRSISLPSSLFTSVSSVTSGTDMHGGIGGWCYEGYSTSSVGGYLWSTASEASRIAIDVSLYVKGTWK